MTDFATLFLTTDASGMVSGEQALDRLAKKGAQTEQRVEKSMTDIGRAAKGAGATIQSAGKQAEAGMAGMAKSADDAKAGMGSMNHTLRQVGMQMSQVSQQGAVTGNYLQALSIQLGDILPMIGIGGLAGVAATAAGALVPLAAGLFDASSAAEKAEKAVDGLSDAVSAYNQYMGIASKSQVELAAQFGMMAGEARAANETLAMFARLDAIEAMDTAVQGLTGTFGGLSDKFVSSRVGGVMREWQETSANLRGELNITGEQAEAVVASLARLDHAGTMEQQISAAVAFKEQMVSAFGSIEQMPKELQTVTRGVMLLAAAGAGIVDPMELARQEQEKIAKTAEEIIAKYDQQAALSRAVAQYGADSAEVEALKREAAVRVADALLEQHNISGLAAEQLLRSAGAAFDAAAGADQAAVALRNAEAAARGLASAIAAAAGFTTNLDNQIAVIETRIAAQRAGADAAIAGQIKSLELQAAAVRDASIAAGEAADIATGRYQQDLERIAQLGALTKQEKALTEAARESAKGRKSATSEAKKAAKEADKLADSLKREAEQWRDLLDPVSKYRRDMADLVKLTGLLSQNEMAEAQRRLNVELADSLPLAGEFVDTMTEGLLNGFTGTLSSLTGMFKKWLAEMIATAWKNRIVVGMSMGGGGMANAAAAAGIPGAPGMGGITGAGGVLGGLGAFGGAFMSGMGGFATALGSGGLGGAAAYTGFMLKGATAGLAGLGSALGAIALPVAAVVAVFSFFKKKTKELDAGLRVTVDGMDTLVETFRTTETKRFWGLSKKVRTSYSAADQETQDALSRVVRNLQAGVMDAAELLGFGADTFAKFAHTMSVSTKGMSEEEAMKAVQDAIVGLGDDFAGMVPGLKRLARDGEGASDALSRLAQSLVGVNGIMDTLGHSFRAAGLDGADMASQLADLFGGLDGMASATQRYYEVFYSEAERLETTTRRTREALAELGVAMPATRDEYRAMVAALDLTTESGREAYAALIGMADAFDLILPQIASLTAELAALQGAVQTGLEGAISAAQEAANANARAAADWYKAAGSIRDYIDKLRGTASALFSPQQALAHNRTRYQATLTQAMAGDLTATQNMTGAADQYLSSVLASAQTREEAALAQARVLSDLGLLQGVGDIEGARHDVIAGLLGQQVDLLEETRDFLANGGALTEEMIDALEGKLGSLEAAIAAAELINYQYLKERLAVTVDVIADADIPAHLKKLLANAATGVEGYVDFIARSDLPADLKWLALSGASEHVKTVEYLAENRLGADLTKIALANVGQLQKTVHLLVGMTLPDDVKRLALAGNSELARIVNATLSSDISMDAKKLALTDLSDHLVRITGQLAKGNTAGQNRLLELMGGATDGKITLGGTFVFDPTKGFQTWYEASTKTAITNPMATLRDAMGTLRGSLSDLRAAIIAETARAEKQTAIAGLNSYVSSLTANAAGNHFVGDDDLAAMARLIGLDTSKLTTAQIRSRLANFDSGDLLKGTVYDPDGSKEKAYLDKLNKPGNTIQPDVYTLADYGIRTHQVGGSDGMAGKAVVTGPLGGIKTFTSGFGISYAESDAKRWLQANNYPAFASGGTHRGGPAYIGENDLELVAPSRIYSPSETRQMLDNRAVVEELKELRSAIKAELEELRAHAQKTSENTRSIDRIQRGWQAHGIGIDPEQNKVTA